MSGKLRGFPAIAKRMKNQTELFSKAGGPVKVLLTVQVHAPARLP
jgi:hypothetical protein